MSRRSFKRDRQGRFAGAGSKVASSTKAATANAGKKATKRTGARATIAKLAMKAASPRTRTAEVIRKDKAQQPARDRAINKAFDGLGDAMERAYKVADSGSGKKLTVTAKPNPARRSAAAGRKVRR